MAYVTPPTWAASTIVASSDLQIVSDDVTYLKDFADAQAGSGVSLLKNASFSCTNNTWTDIPWASAPVDIGGWWTSGATATVPTGLVPSGYSAVVVEVQASAVFDTNGTGIRGIQVLLNGSLVEIPFGTSALAGDTTPVMVTAWAVCVDGDALKVQVLQTSGGSLNATHALAHIKRIMPVP